MRRISIQHPGEARPARRSPLAIWDFHEDPDAGEADISPCKRLLESMLIQALCDAHSVDRLIKAEARAWFREGLTTAGGWSWLSGWLDLSEWVQVRLEDYAADDALSRRRGIKKHLRGGTGYEARIARSRDPAIFPDSYQLPRRVDERQPEPG